MYEDFPRLYRKEEVDVSISGKRETAIAYVMEPTYALPSLPYKSYLDGVMQAYTEHGIDTAPLSEALKQTSRLVNNQNRTGGRK